MKRSAWRKNNLRELKNTLGRFLAIFAIVALGVGFFAGVKLARPAMVNICNDYLEENRFYDFQLLSTLGITGEDRNYFAAMEGVEAAEGSVTADLLTTYGGGQIVLKTHQLLEELNQVNLVAGRMPEAPNECLADDMLFTEADIGTVFPVENDEDDSLFTQESYTIVGVCNTPQYLNLHRGTTSLGSGSVYAFLYLPAEGYDSEYFTELYLRVDVAHDAFQTAYNDAVDAWEQPLADALELRGELRKDDVVAEAQAELDDGWEEYFDGLAEYEDAKAEVAQELADAEAELADGRQELEDGEKELAELREDPYSNEELADARRELDDGWKELHKGEAEYFDGLKEFEEAKAKADVELADAKKELEDAEAELAKLREDPYSNEELDDARKQLDEGWAALKDGGDQYRAGKEQLAATRSQLEAAQQQLDAGWAQYKAGAAQYEAGKAQAEAQLEAIRAGVEGVGAQLTLAQEALAARQAQLEALQSAEKPDPDAIAEAQQAVADAAANVAMAQAAYDSAKAQADAAGAAIQEQLETSRAQLDASKVQLEQNQAQLDDGFQQLQAGEQTLAETQAMMAESRQQLVDGEEELEQGIEEALAEGEKAIADGWTEYYNAIQELEDAEAELEDAKLQLYDARHQLLDGEQELTDGIEEALTEAEEALADGWAEYEDGMAEYLDGKAEAEQELAEAEAELEDAKRDLDKAQKQVDNLKDPSYYALNRMSNNGYASFDNDTNIVASIAEVFPIFFFLVAALVCSSTMTRMVEEQRTQNGTLKAMGYSDLAIMWRYASYAGSAALLGFAVGYLAGAWLFPYVIWEAYQMLYHFGEIEYLLDWQLAIISLGCSLLSSVGAACAAAWSEMRQMPAQLMRPKAPKAGKRIFLEHITPLWRHMDFLHKVAARNIFRYKKRLFMMLLGVGGCTALLIAGFGLRDSISSVADDQFDTITTYDYIITFRESQSQSQREDFTEEYAGTLTDCVFVSAEAYDALTDMGIKTVNVVATADPAIENLLGLYDGETDLGYPSGTGVYLSAKLAEMAGLQAGDSLTIQLEDKALLEIPITAIFENYVYHYLYMTEEAYTHWFGHSPAYNTVYAATAQEDVYALSADMQRYEDVANITLTQDIRSTFNDTITSLNAIIVLVIGCALALSFVVSYNLININITERVREIATIKVLGFYRRETHQYVFREGLVLTGMGIAVGVPLGIWLHAFIMGKIQVDFSSFPVIINLPSFAAAVVLTFLIAMVVNLLLRGKIDKVNMAESLKSVE